MAVDVGGGFFPASGHDYHRLGGGIVTVFHAGSLHHRVFVDLSGNSLVDHQITQHLQQYLWGNSAGAQQPGAFLCQIHNGGFYAHPAGASVHNGIDFSIVIVEHVLCSGGGGFSGEIGGGRGDGHPGQTDDGTGDIVVRAADGHGGKTCCGAFGNHIPGREHHGHRTRPNSICQGIGTFRNGMTEPLHFGLLSHMENQGVVLRPTLSRKNTGHRRFIQAIGTQPVYGFCGDSHQTAPADDSGGNFSSGGVGSGEQ